MEKASRFLSWVRKTRTTPADTVGHRFIKLFESHNVHRNQIPRFFGHGLTLKDVQDEAFLIQKLDETLLDAASNLFGVRREWLEGAESQIYPCHDFYKHPEEVLPFLTGLRDANPNGDLNGVLLAPVEYRDDAVIILSELIGNIGDKPIYRYHICNNWLFDYWKSRAYLTAFVAIAWKCNICLRGRYLPLKEIQQLADGYSLLSVEDEGIFLRGRLWYPEDMAIEAEAFLLGIDPEKDNYGLTSALKLWLSLEEKGYMNTGLSMYTKEEIQSSFKHALEQELES
ncbi:hypothetical protein [Methylophilus sp. Q8]|uniref:hypothetical protein n=1 Tax=Methylophilus sp. Q8 TaxID=1506586 RepID=UPI00126A2DF5|nr:hypothetical protein [Methylophilus sp. Q8]